jgi:hypothetical protein
MGLTDAAVRSHARKLESKGYLHRRVRKGVPNYFFLEPLFEQLELLMDKVAKEEKEKKQQEIEDSKWQRDDE